MRKKVFPLHQAYLCSVWDQAKYFLKRITVLLKKAVGVLHSTGYWDHISPLFHRYKVLKFVDLVSSENCIFVGMI